MSNARWIAFFKSFLHWSTIHTRGSKSSNNWNSETQFCVQMSCVTKAFLGVVYELYDNSFIAIIKNGETKPNSKYIYYKTYLGA
jgi:hypothetical protein